MKRYCACLLLVLAVVCSCSRRPQIAFRYQSDPEIQKLVRENTSRYPDASFMVLADLHVVATELWSDGQATRDYLEGDCKLLKESPEVLDSALAAAARTPSDFIIVCGDMTKDGELASHQLAAAGLARLAQAGKHIYVVPGNHDINNGWSYRYKGDTKSRVPAVTRDEFADIYREFGYQALDRDTASLSYVAEPVPGLWLLCMDDCQYYLNQPDLEQHTAGRFKPQTLRWIEDRLIESVRQKKAVIGAIHHAVLEHYRGNWKYYPEFMVENFEEVSAMLAAYGVRLVFTGHYHAQDITLKRWNDTPGQFLFDIETGSLATYPVPYRLVRIKDQRMEICSHFVSSIRDHPGSFTQYAFDFRSQWTERAADRALRKYLAPRADREAVGRNLAQAYMSHLRGDEVPVDLSIYSNASWWTRLITGKAKSLSYGFSQDLPPRDNDIAIDLRTGECTDMIAPSPGARIHQ